MANTPQRRWYRFRLRTLLILVAVVAVPLAWVAKERRGWPRSGVSRSGNSKLPDCFKTRDPTESDLPACTTPMTGAVMGNRKAGGARLRKVLGERIVQVWSQTGDCKDLTPLAGLKNLKRVHLCFTQVSDLAPLAGLNELELLWLSEAPVDDLTPLAGLTKLESLHLESTKIHDLAPLAGITHLREIYLQGTQATKVQVEALQKALPHCRIEHDPFL